MGFGVIALIIDPCPSRYTVTLLAWPFIRWSESRMMRRLKERLESLE